MYRVNYIIAAWGGPRRVVDESYEKDRTCYLRDHIKQLRRIKHSCFVTVVVPAMTHGDRKYHDFMSFVDSKLEGMVDRIRLRPNNGMSYGSWSSEVLWTLGAYDYYIFMEDDYVFLLDDFDKKMVKMYNSHKDCIYLCGNVDPKTSSHIGHARHSCGIISTINAKKVIDEIGKFDYLDKEDATPFEHEDYKTQKKFSSSMVKCTGMKLYDVCSNYAAGLRMKHGGIKWYGKGDKLIDPIQYLSSNKRYPTRKPKDVDAYLKKA